jgi:outer membrane immunogenic protein
MYKLTLAAALAATFASSAALAADIPRKNTPPVLVSAPPAFTWTGAYLGSNLGYIQTRDKATIRAVDPTDDSTFSQIGAVGADRTRFKASGFTGGGQIGYNYQITPGSGLVVGIETDLQYTDAKRRRLATNTYSGPSRIFRNATWTDTLSNDHSDQLDYIGTVRGRIGYAFDRVLVYGTGGLAYGNVKYRGAFLDVSTWTSNVSGASISSYGLDASRSNHVQTGYAYGGGIEYAIPTDSFLNFFRASAVTLKAEYLHYDLGSRTIVARYSTDGLLKLVSSGVVTKLKNEGDIVRAGVNYKFGTF